MDKVIRCDEIAKRYQVSVATVWRWIREKRIPAIKVGRTYVVREKDLAAVERASMTRA